VRRPPEATDALRQAFAVPASLLVGAAEAGDTLAVLPVLFHLIWHQVVAADLGSGPLGSASPVWLWHAKTGAHQALFRKLSRSGMYSARLVPN
jgi:hypothetical protein